MIISIILLLILALALWGIYMMAGKAVNGVPLAIVGIILILIWLGCAFYFLRNPKLPWSASKKGLLRHSYVVRRAYNPLKPGHVVAFVITRNEPSI